MKTFTIVLPVILLGTRAGLAASVNVQSSASRAPVGTSVHFSASTDLEDGSTIRYRFRTRKPGGEFQTVRDFGPGPSLDWTTLDRDGTYQIEVTAEDMVSGDTMVATSDVQFDPLTEKEKGDGHPYGECARLHL